MSLVISSYGKHKALWSTVEIDLLARSISIPYNTGKHYTQQKRHYTTSQNRKRHPCEVNTQNLSS